MDLVVRKKMKYSPLSLPQVIHEVMCFVHETRGIFELDHEFLRAVAEKK
jgi:hypothetical protein